MRLKSGNDVFYYLLYLVCKPGSIKCTLEERAYNPTDTNTKGLDFGLQNLPSFMQPSRHHRNTTHKQGKASEDLHSCVRGRMTEPPQSKKNVIESHICRGKD